MFLVRFLKSGNLDRLQFIVCTILLVILYFILNTMVEKSDVLWRYTSIYYITLLFISCIFSLLVISRLRSCKLKHPIIYGLFITLTIYTAYISSLFLLDTGYGVIIYIASQLSTLILFSFLVFKK